MFATKLKIGIATTALSAFIIPTASATVSGNIHPRHIEKIADILEIETSELKEKLVFGQTLAEIKKELNITDEQKKALKSLKTKHHKHKKHPVLMEKLAEALGITKDALIAELKAGKSPKEVAAAHNIDLKTFKEEIRTQWKEDNKK